MTTIANSTLPAIPPDVALITGPTLLGIMLNWGFMGVLCVQIYFYHLNFPNDTTFIKSLVYGLFVIDILQTCLVSADAFHWYAFGFGNMNQLDDTFLNSWDVPFLDSIIALIVQSFYCWRIHIIRGRSVFIPLFIVAISITQCVGGIVTAVKAHMLGHLSLISTEVVEQTIWLVGSAVADILITITLAWTLMRSRRSELPASQRMLSRLVRLTVETNALTAGVAVISLILFLGVPQHSTLVVPPTAVIGKLYTNCLVAVLNNRRLNSRSLESGGKGLSSSNTGVPSGIQSLRSGENYNLNNSKLSHNTSGGAVRIQVLQETDRNRDDLDFNDQDPRDIRLETYKTPVTAV